MNKIRLHTTDAGKLLLSAYKVLDATDDILNVEAVPAPKPVTYASPIAIFNTLLTIEGIEEAKHDNTLAMQTIFNSAYEAQWGFIQQDCTDYFWYCFHTGLISFKLFEE